MTNDNSWSNAEGYSNIGGCYFKHPFNMSRRLDCEESFAASSHKVVSANADLALAQATMAKVSNVIPDAWTPLAVGGVVAVSLLGIATMVILIKKSKRKA